MPAFVPQKFVSRSIVSKHTKSVIDWLSIAPVSVLTCGKLYTQGISLVGRFLTEHFEERRLRTEDTNKNFNQFKLPF
jgi:hypothetical protein